MANKTIDYIAGLLQERSTYVGAATLVALLTRGKVDLSPWMDTAMMIGVGAGNAWVMATRDTSKQAPG